MQAGDVYQQRVRIIGPDAGLFWDAEILTGVTKGWHVRMSEQQLNSYYEPTDSSREDDDSPPLAALRVIRDAPPGTMASQLRQMAREALAGIE